MKNTFILFFATITYIATFAQKSNNFHQAHHHHGTICKIGEVTSGVVIPAPAVGRNEPKEPLVFEITYANNVPSIAKGAFERATAILSGLFSSPMPISVFVSSSREQESNTLAGAFPGTYLRNFRNAPLRNAWYPIALAEKIARQEFNSTRTPYDIEVIYNANQNWNYLSDNLGNNEFDFVTVMLHELIHGLGFSNLGNVASNQGTLRFDGWPTAYSSFIENGAGQTLINEIEDPSIAMGTELRSNNLFMKTATLAAQNSRAKIYAPSIFSTGSSISHLDRNTYINTPHALMSPNINFGTVIHNPGSITLNILYDLGWTYTTIIHEPGTPTEAINQPYTVTATVYSDEDYAANSVTLHYSRDTFKTVTEIIMTPTSKPDEFTATLPAPGELAKYQYYFSVEDNRNLTFVSPTEAPNPLFYEFFYDVDDTNPEIVHESEKTLDDKSTLFNVEASVTDFFTGLEEVVIEYNINGIAAEPIAMQRDLSDGFRPDLYVGTIELPNTGLEEGDILEYRIVAVDKSPARNTKTNPSDGSFHSVEIIKTLDAIRMYVNDFTVDDHDFRGQGFSIRQPNGFDSPAIHSLHPYTNAGENNTRNFNFQLRLPIIIRTNDPFIEFNEIVLVEPGDAGTNYGQTEFWDYVIVEGRRTNSSEWLPFLDGYDSNADPAWRNAYNSGISGSNSQTTGTESLYRFRKINMQANGNFAAGDTVLIRFRLFSDPFAVGWGWAIDDLRIQDTDVAVSDFIEEQGFNIYPNPIGSQELTVEAHFKQSVKEVAVQITNIHGQQLFAQRYANKGFYFKQAIDLRPLAKGIYLVTLTMDNQEWISRRVVRE